MQLVPKMTGHIANAQIYSLGNCCKMRILKIYLYQNFQIILKTTFDTDRIIGIINEFESLYTNEIEEHIDRWSYPNSKTSIGKMKLKS